MDKILRLDRDGWTYETAKYGAGLRHTDGIMVEVDITTFENTWLVYVKDPIMRQMVLVLTCIGQGRKAPLPGRWTEFWSHIEACSGSLAQAEFQRAYAEIRDIAIRRGITGQVLLQRGGQRGDWIFASTDGVETGSAPFGILQPKVDAILDRVRNVSVCSHTGQDHHSGHLSHVGLCAWDILYTQHERLALLSQPA